MTDPRQAAIELMNQAYSAWTGEEISGEGEDSADWVLDALLSDEGRPLLWALMDALPDPNPTEETERVVDWQQVERLKGRGVLIRITDPDENYADEPDLSLYMVRLPSEEDAK